MVNNIFARSLMKKVCGHDKGIRTPFAEEALGIGRNGIVGFEAKVGPILFAAESQIGSPDDLITHISAHLYFFRYFEPYPVMGLHHPDIGDVLSHPRGVPGLKAGKNAFRVMGRRNARRLPRESI